MKRILAILVGTAVVAFAAGAHSETLGTMDRVESKIMGCWTPPVGSGGSSVTLRFSFKRDGTLFGDPQPTSVNVSGDSKTRRKFVAAAIDALKTCGPLQFSDTLAKGIGGTVFTLIFEGADKRGGLKTPERLKAE